MNGADLVAVVTTAATTITVVVSMLALRTDRLADVHDRMPILLSPRRDSATITIHNVGRGRRSTSRLRTVDRS